MVYTPLPPSFWQIATPCWFNHISSENLRFSLVSTANQCYLFPFLLLFDPFYHFSSKSIKMRQKPVVSSANHGFLFINGHFFGIRPFSRFFCGICRNLSENSIIFLYSFSFTEGVRFYIINVKRIYPYLFILLSRSAGFAQAAV